MPKTYEQMEREILAEIRCLTVALQVGDTEAAYVAATKVQRLVTYLDLEAARQ